jgi:anti-sigma factor RsiW
LTCKELISFLSAYLDGELPAEKQQLFDRHLSVCPDCVAYMESYKHTISLLKEQGIQADSPIPEDIPQSLLDAILAARSK